MILSKLENKNPSDIIEIHNRPSYVHSDCQK